MRQLFSIFNNKSYLSHAFVLNKINVHCLKFLCVKGGGIAQSSPAFGAAAAGATAGSGVGSFTLGQTRTATRKVSARRRH